MMSFSNHLKCIVVLGPGFSLNASLSATYRNLSASADSRLVWEVISGIIFIMLRKIPILPII